MRQLIAAWCFLIFWGALCMSGVGRAQRFNELYDLMPQPGQQGFKGGMNVFINADRSYFLTAYTATAPSYTYGLANAIISEDGQTIISKHFFNGATTYTSGVEGGAKRLGDGFVAPFGIYGTLATTSGIIRYNSQGDTVFTRVYTDTMRYTDGAYYIDVLPDSSFLVVGERDSIGYRRAWGYLQHISATGQLLWTRTYIQDTASQNRFTRVQSLSDRRILISGMIVKPARIGQYSFHFNHPWMLLADSNGNILRDTVYSDHYYPGAFIGGGDIHIDINGGYFHWGGKDSTPMPFPQSVQYMGNFPDYVAHLDTNFNIVWRLSFPPRGDNLSGGYGSIFQVIQTKDSGYLVMGALVGGYAKGWLAKLSKNGKIQWEHTYKKDSTSNGYLVDAEERATGGFVAVGWTKACETCSQDIWLLSVDSSGCEQADCTYTPVSVPPALSPKTDLSVYPNPTTGRFWINSSNEGTLDLLDLLGNRVLGYPIKEGKNDVVIPLGLATGVYLGRFTGRNHTLSVVRIIYQP